MAAPRYSSSVFRFAIGQAGRLRVQAERTYRWAKLTVQWGCHGILAALHGYGHQRVQTWQRLVQTVRQAVSPSRPCSAVNQPEVDQSSMIGPEGGQLLSRPIARRRFRTYSGLQHRGGFLQTGSQLLAWLLQALAYFFNRPAQPRLGDRKVSHIAGQPSAIAGHGRSLKPISVRLAALSVLQWIRAAIAYFFGARSGQPLGLKQSAQTLVGQPRFGVLLLPSTPSWGQAVNQRMSQWCQVLMPWLGTVSSLAVPSKCSQELVLKDMADDRALMVNGSIPVPMPGLAITRGMAAAATQSAPRADHWLEVPVTAIGYERSPLGWCLFGLDWAFWGLERGMGQVLRWLRQGWQRILRLLIAKDSPQGDSQDAAK